MIDTNFQTPNWCAKYMVSLIPDNISTILEPAPGLGNIVKLLDKYIVTAPDNFWDINDQFDAIIEMN